MADHRHVIEQEILVKNCEMIHGKSYVLQCPRIATTRVTHRSVIEVPRCNTAIRGINSQSGHQRLVETRPPKPTVDEDHNAEWTDPRRNSEIADLLRCVTVLNAHQSSGHGFGRRWNCLGCCRRDRCPRWNCRRAVGYHGGCRRNHRCLGRRSPSRRFGSR